MAVDDVVLGMLDEAVLLFGEDGTVSYANDAAALLLGVAADGLAGHDVKDYFYSVDLARPEAGLLPFPTDGSSSPARAKSADGSFVPVCVRCHPLADGSSYAVVARLDERYEADRERTHLLEELRRAEGRLRGTLSIVSSATLGENSFEALALRVANELESVMAADAVVLYLADDYGFTPYGVSRGFDALGIDSPYLPMGVGIPTLVVRNRRTVRLQLVSPSQSPDGGAIMLDLDTDTRFRLRSGLASRCSTLVGTPVFTYDRVVAVVVAGWLSPHPVASDDVRLLDTVADFLSVEFSAAVTQMEQRRASSFNAAGSEIRELVRDAGEMTTHLAAQIAGVVGGVVPSHIMIMESGLYSQTTLVRLFDPDRGEECDALEFPHGMSEVFSEGSGFVAIGPSSPCGMWIGRHTDLEAGFGVLLTSGEASDEPLQEALLVMRGSRDHPFDDAEVSFLRSLSNEVGTTLHAEQERAHDAQISQALQVGLRNELPGAPGVTTSSLYISATESAVVGGDFFDLYDLAEGRIIVVLGDVSGKGVEAAAMASLVKTALAAYAWNFLDPASMVASLNNLFLNFSRLETFASLVVVSIDFAAGQATYCSAGHPPAMVVHRPSSPAAELELLTVQSPIVGAFEGLEYVNGAFEFERGDILYLYTDGTTEARSPSGDFFGEDMLRETLLRVCRAGVEHVPQGVLDAVEEFAGGDLHDDIAMVAVRFDGLDGEGEAPRPARGTAPSDR